MNQSEAQVLKTGVTYTFEIELRRQPRPDYDGPRNRVRPWQAPNIPSRLEINALQCERIGEPELITAPEPTRAFDRIAWRFSVRPLQSGDSIISLKCYSADNALIAKDRINVEIEGDPVPARAVPPPPPPPAGDPEPIMFDFAVHPVMLTPNDSRNIGRLIEDFVAAVTALDAPQSVPIMQAVGKLVMQHIQNKIPLMRLEAFPEGTPITIIIQDAPLPLDIAHGADGFMNGLKHAVGYNFPKTSGRPARPLRHQDYTVVTVGNPTLTIAHPSLHVRPAAGKATNPHARAFLRLRDWITRQKCPWVHVRGLARDHRLIVSLSETDVIEWLAGHDDNDADGAFGNVGIVFIAPYGPPALFPAWKYAKPLLMLGVRAVIAPLAPLPEAIHSEFAQHFYPLLAEGKSIGEALRLTRNHLWIRHHNPAGLLYTLFGPPELRLEQA